MAKWVEPKTWVTGEYVHMDEIHVALNLNMLALREQKIVQSGDVAKTTTTFENLTGMEIPVYQSELWHFNAFIYFTSNSTANLKLAWRSENVLGTATDSIMFGRYGLWGSGVPITNGHVAEYVASPAAAQTVNIVMGTSLADLCVCTGSVLALVDGSIQLMGAQNTASGTTTFRASSFIVAWRADI